MDPNIDNGRVVSTTEEIGSLIRLVRNEQGMNQMVVAGIFGSGNRFISDAENGKKTIQAQKLLDLLGMVGLEVVIRRKRTDA
ncbi:MAG: transcriptional regulator [Thiobacillus sp.]|jgi:HTH-type transcriptional regulator/antitoxin HipB|nr:transcriptional regulator [Thiobacillus sp.]MDP2980323.1 transcriptional regulator [Thiobacillus sp.]